MWLLNMFGGGNKNVKRKKKSKKGGKKVEKKIDPSLLNPVKEVKIYGVSKMGYGPKKTECQDSFCIMENFHDSYHFFAVYDGHGSSGKEASQAANDFIQTYIEKNIKRVKLIQTERQAESFIKAAFKNAESRLKGSGIDYSNSGTCAISVLVLRDQCYIANLGDSRAVLFRQNKDAKQAIELSWDHKPTRPDEKHRIQKSGGKIEKLIHEGQPVGPFRVWQDDEGPGIAMTRTLGDLQAKKIGLISEPEIEHFVLREKDEFIVIGSDGIWDVMTSAEVVGFVLHCLENIRMEDNTNMKDRDPREQIAEKLVAEARSRWEDLNKNKKKNAGLGIGDVPYLRYGCDDITAVVALFSYYNEEEMEERIRMPVNNISTGQKSGPNQGTAKDSGNKYQVNANSSVNRGNISRDNRDHSRDASRDDMARSQRPQGSPTMHNQGTMNKSMNSGAVAGLAKTMMSSVKH